jgi:hypothetical protein
VCRLVHYPLRTSTGAVRNVRDCVKAYADVFNARVVAAVTKQRFEKLFVNYQGVMIGDGEVWMSSLCRDKDCRTSVFVIVTVNNREPSR